MKMVFFHWVLLSFYPVVTATAARGNQNTSWKLPAPSGVGLVDAAAG
jgi:hypothetical protein